MDVCENSIAQTVLQQPEIEQDVPICLTQHSVLRITLNGPALVFTILSIIICIQVFQPSLTCTLIALSPLPLIIHNDYENFILLGPGGTPSTFLGYLKITYLRLFALSDPYTPVTFPDEKIFPSIGCYQRAEAWLPKRSGPRPIIAGIAPQRQIDQPGCPKTYQALRTILKNVSIKNEEALRIGISCFEKRGLALFARHPINTTCRGEICHVHDSDRSLHMNLHPDDAKAVLENGWGERHPLSKGGWMKKYVPREFVMVYAPRNEKELSVVCRIIEAAGFWVTGQRFEMNGEKDLVLEMKSQGLSGEISLPRE